MRPNFWLPLLIYLPVITACVHRGKPDSAQDLFSPDPIYLFDMEESVGRTTAHTFVLNTITDSVSFIPLETNAKSFFTNFANEFAATEEFFWITGSGGIDGKGVFQFVASSGTFVREIAKKGRGPGELPYINSWSINKSLNTICVVGPQKIVVGSLDAGSTSDIFLNGMFEFFNIAILNDSSLTFSKSAFWGKQGSNIPHLMFINFEGDILHSIHYTDKRERHYEMNERIQSRGPFENYRISANYKGDALFKDVFNDTIYYIKGHHEIYPYLVFTSGRYAPKVKDANNDEQKAKQIYVRDITETEKYFLIKYSYNKMRYTDIWDKSSQQIVSRMEAPTDAYGPTQMFNARYMLPDGSETILNIVYAEKERLYCLLEASVACQFLDGVEEDANPVVMILQLKP